MRRQAKDNGISLLHICNVKKMGPFHKDAQFPQQATVDFLRTLRTQLMRKLSMDHLFFHLSRVLGETHIENLVSKP